MSYDDTGGGGGSVIGGSVNVNVGYLDQSDPRLYCTGGYCMGDTIMARGLCGEELELDMRRHIQACACTCNHMGYGNYMDYQVSITNYMYNMYYMCTLVREKDLGYCVYVKTMRLISNVLLLT